MHVALSRCHRDDAVIGAVEGGTHQLGHTSVEDGEAEAVVVLLQVDDARQERAGGTDQRAARLDDEGEAGVFQDRQNGGRVLTRRRDGGPVVGNAEAAAQVQVIDVDAVAAQLAGQRDRALGGAAQRLERGDLRADVNVQADRRQTRLAGVLAVEGPHLVERHAELVGLQPRGDMRVAPGVDVGVHAHRHAHRRVEGACPGGDPIELAGRLGVDRLHAERDGAVELVAGLADAGEDDLLRDVPGA